MTRITFGLYRAGVRDTGVSLSTFATAFMPPTPFPTASAAIVRFHRENPDSAWRELDRSFKKSPYWGVAGTPQAGWANAIRDCFGVYRQMAHGDARPAFATGLHRDLAFPPDELAVYVDVVLLDPNGYVPRLVLWDKSELTPSRASLYAAPAWRVLEDELGDGRVPFVEVWNLRSGAQLVASAAEAAAVLGEVARVVHRVGT